MDPMQRRDEERLILVTNDDGYGAKGLRAAIEVARRFGEDATRMEALLMDENNWFLK